VAADAIFLSHVEVNSHYLRARFYRRAWPSRPPPIRRWCWVASFWR
jgi:hypothetical protein